MHKTFTKIKLAKAKISNWPQKGKDWRDQFMLMGFSTNNQSIIGNPLKLMLYLFLSLYFSNSIYYKNINKIEESYWWKILHVWNNFHEQTYVHGYNFYLHI